MRKSLHSIDQYKEYPAVFSLPGTNIWTHLISRADSEHRSLTLCSPLQLYSEAATLNKSPHFSSIAFLILYEPSLCVFRHILISTIIPVHVHCQETFPSIISPPRQKAPGLNHLFLQRRVSLVPWNCCHLSLWPLVRARAEVYKKEHRVSLLYFLYYSPPYFLMHHNIT